MWIANLSMVAIIAGCVAFQYLKGTAVKAFATIIVTIVAGVVAFGFFEPLARYLSGYSASLAPWAQMLCFGLLFVLAFALLQTGVSQLMRQPIDLGLWPERVGRVICGMLLGLLVSGMVLIVLQMGPLPIKYPYQRFEKGRQKVLLNPDGLATGIFSLLSNGSFSGKKSFATVHPGYLDQLFLNRLLIGSDIPILSQPQAIDVPPKAAAWPAPDAIRKQVEDLLSRLDSLQTPAQGTTTKPVLLPGWEKGNYDLMIVRIGIKKEALKAGTPLDAGTFGLAQLRLICKERRGGDSPLTGEGVNIYPIGHMKSANELQTSFLIQLKREDYEERARVKYIDFVFCVPRGYVPVLAEFKQNSIAEVPPPVPADQAPPVIGFVASEVKLDAGRSDRRSRGQSESSSRRPQSSGRRGRLSDTSRSIIGPLDDE
jgi:hypothetical protein